MVKISVVSDALNSIMNAEKKGKREVLLHPSSKVIIAVLKYMQKKDYIGDFTVIDDNCSNKIVVSLTGRLTKCAVISPRYDVTLDKLEHYTSNLLPSRHSGHILLTTSSGIMDHEEARSKENEGKLLAYFF